MFQCHTFSMYDKWWQLHVCKLGEDKSPMAVAVWPIMFFDFDPSSGIKICFTKSDSNFVIKQISGKSWKTSQKGTIARDNEPAWPCSDNPSHINEFGFWTEDWAVESERLENWPRPSTALPKRVWGTAKGLLALFSRRIFWLMQGLAPTSSEGSYAQAFSAGNIFYDTGPLMGCWVGLFRRRLR